MLVQFVIFGFLCTTFSVCQARDRTEMCKKGEHLASISRNQTTGAIQLTCNKLLNNDKDTSCTTLKPMKCDGSKEGCPNGSWLAGFDIFEMDDNVEMLQPLCCSSKTIRINQKICSKNMLRTSNNDPLPTTAITTSSRLNQGIWCYLLPNRSGRVLKTVLVIEACKYDKQ
ncbi:hypothetical protein T02_13739 [Trichinella nativa]|uniref:Secreted protein n=1 Tax=Trichinella nativa TaxID=6335 RepID=A0A0V1L1G3_9BILA|nr:hypothetical protein T09_12024 [Trichinella sp. T9]KRX85141.1 hypothetical protein T06_6816 [Trichinella sp. T6]KRZ53408.1 hypothetical protein T02_13739 [Trichinella nativa]KRZ94548.1 hypothetical protein T08_10385 [Trichinella sp. T8]